MKHSIIAKTLTIAAVGALVLGIAPRAMACSEATLRGTFVYTSTGSLVSAPFPSSIWGPYAEVGTQYFDGKGNVSFAFNSSTNGSVGPGTANGTYTVNDDCTGTFTETSDGFTSHFSFVIDQGGEGLQAICQDQGAVVTRTVQKQFPRGE